MHLTVPALFRLTTSESPPTLPVVATKGTHKVTHNYHRHHGALLQFGHMHHFHISLQLHKTMKHCLIITNNLHIGAVHLLVLPLVMLGMGPSSRILNSLFRSSISLLESHICKHDNIVLIRWTTLFSIIFGKRISHGRSNLFKVILIILTGCQLGK